MLELSINPDSKGLEGCTTARDNWTCFQWHFMDFHGERGWRVVPLQETIGRVFNGILWIFMVRYRTPKGVFFGLWRVERMNFRSCLLRICFHLSIHFFRVLWI